MTIRQHSLGSGARHAARPPARWRAAVFTAAALALGTWTLTTTAQVAEVPKPEGLKGIAVPEPSNLAQFVSNKAAAVRLGKALFWDTQLGSDGKTACASCHFHAGADNRTRNTYCSGCYCS